jgi:hypothetical protein
MNPLFLTSRFAAWPCKRDIASSQQAFIQFSVLVGETVVCAQFIENEWFIGYDSNSVDPIEAVTKCRTRTIRFGMMYTVRWTHVD